MKKIGIGSAILVGVLLVGGVVWLVLSGKLVIIWNGAAVQYSAASNVCGDDVVTAYNSNDFLGGIMSFRGQSWSITNHNCKSCNKHPRFHVI